MNDKHTLQLLCVHMHQYIRQIYLVITKLALTLNLEIFANENYESTDTESVSVTKQFYILNNS